MLYPHGNYFSVRGLHVEHDYEGVLEITPRDSGFLIRLGQRIHINTSYTFSISSIFSIIASEKDTRRKTQRKKVFASLDMNEVAQEPHFMNIYSCLYTRHAQYRKNVFECRM